jgi:hypothetical protein
MPYMPAVLIALSVIVVAVLYALSRVDRAS